jgi:hypothetical protein
MQSVDISQLAKIPYLDIGNLQGRFASNLLFHDEGNWRMWLLAGKELVEIKAWPAEAYYFARAPEAPTDICFEFIDFIAQRASYNEVQKPILGLWDDIFNLSTSLAKIAHLHKTKDELGTGVSRMVITEVEYIFSVCKSIFDLLQEIISTLWQWIHLLDPSVLKKPLRDTFSKTLLHKGQASTAAELTSRFGLPMQLSEFYVRHSAFFMTLREFRDNIIHRGSQVQTIYPGDNGFLISDSVRPFSSMKIWREDEKQTNNLVPLMPALGTVIRNTLAACEDFSTTIQQVIQFPPPIVPGMRFYMRGFFNELFSAVMLDAAQRVMPESTAVKKPDEGALSS